MWPLWAAGQIDEFKVATIDHAAARLTQGESWVKLDDALAPIAATKTTQQLRTWLNRFIAHRARRVSSPPPAHDGPTGREHRAGSDGTGWVTDEGNSTDTAEVGAVINKMARQLGAHDPRSIGQRRSDIFFGLLLGRIPNGASGGKRPGPTAIGITVPIQSLVGDAAIPGQLTSLPHSLTRDKLAHPQDLTSLHPDDYLPTDAFEPDDPILDDLPRNPDMFAPDPTPDPGRSVSPPNA